MVDFVIGTSALFFRNKRLLTLTICLIVVAGVSSYRVLPRLEDPPVTGRIAVVNTVLPGADAERIEALVTRKLEDELRDVEQIDELRSASRVGISTILIELREDVYNADSVWPRIHERIDDAAVELPDDALPPDFETIEPNAFALIVGLTWTHDGRPNLAILRRLAETLKSDLEQLPGTETVELFGNPNEEICVEVRPAEVAALGLTPADIARQVRASDAKTAAGQLRTGNNDFLLSISGELNSLSRIRRIPIAYGDDGRFVPLGSIATISKGISDPLGSLAVVDGHTAVVLGARARRQRRIDLWTQAAQAELERFEANLPRGVGLSMVFEQSRYVEDRLERLMRSLFLGGLAVMAVVFVMMGWRSALVVGAALPLSGLMVLSGMRLLEIPIHQMSVTGLIIALGLLIDNAIVVVDEIDTRLKEGRTAREAIDETVRRLAVPLLGSTLTTALAFAPLAIMGGKVGEFVGPIAVSVILAVGSSFVLAMTVIPAMRALVTGTDVAANSKQWSPTRGAFRWLGGAYRFSLDWLFRRPLLGIAFGLALPIAGFVHARTLPEQFFPPADRDQFHIEVELPVQTSMSQTLTTVKNIRQSVLQHEQVRRADWFLGESAPTFYYNIVSSKTGLSYYAQGLVQLTSPHAARDVIRELQAQLDVEFPQARILVRQLEQGPAFAAPVEVRLFGPDIERLRKLGDDVRLLLSQTPDVLHTRSNLSESPPKLALSVDEEQARLVGLDHSAIAQQLHTAFDGVTGGSILEEAEELPVRVRLSRHDRTSPQKLASLDLTSPGGRSPAWEENRPVTGRTEEQTYAGVPINALAELSLKPKVGAIPHRDGRRLNEVQAFIPAGVLPAQVLQDFRTRLQASDFQLPPDYRIEFGGEAAERNAAVDQLMAHAGVLLVLMMATLVLSLRSFRLAALIAVVAVLSLGLGLAALWIFEFPFGFMAIIGTMGLLGVAINDAIVVLAGLDHDAGARQGDPQAVGYVVMRCTRHVVATSLTTMAGFLPLLLAGGGFWPPLAIAIAGGVSGATILALSFVPSAYCLVPLRSSPGERRHRSVSRSMSGPAGADRRAAPVGA